MHIKKAMNVAAKYSLSYKFYTVTVKFRIELNCTAKTLSYVYLMFWRLIGECLPICRNFDIMDSMIQKLEKYADNLENIVQTRTADLIDEKHKTDMLLQRMLPP